MVQFQDLLEEDRKKEFEALQSKRIEALKEIENEKEKKKEEVRNQELGLEALRREKAETERKLKALTEKGEKKSQELEAEEKELKERAGALAKKIEEEAEAVSRLRKQAVQVDLEEAVTEAAQGLPEQPIQAQPQTLYQSPSRAEESSLYQRLAELRSGIYGVASHQITGGAQVPVSDRSQIGSLYTQLQDIVQNLASHAVEGRRLDEASATQVTQALNVTMQAVEKLGEIYSERFENLLNRARGYISGQEDTYKTSGT